MIGVERFRLSEVRIEEEARRSLRSVDSEMLMRMLCGDDRSVGVYVMNSVELGRHARTSTLSEPVFSWFHATCIKTQ